MNAQVIARLEGLLARVRQRAAEPRAPRRTADGAASPSTAAAPAPAPAAARQEAPVAPEPVVPLEVAAIEVSAVEIEVTAPVEVVAAAVEEAAPPAPAEAFESRERIIAAAPVGEPVSESAPELALEPPAAAAPSPEPEALPASAIEEVVEVEEAPVSSRRPLAPEPEERLEQMAFGAEEPQPARHTPPPESGRLPAAPAPDFDGDDVTGVRDAPPVPAPAARLEPEVTRAAMPEGERAADVLGDARRFAPDTFVALLDASLAL